MILQVLPGEFSICKVSDMSAVDLTVQWLFVSKTDAELSVVCLREDVPRPCEVREDGWRAFRVAGQLDFCLTGVLAGLSTGLAQTGWPRPSWFLKRRGMALRIIQPETARSAAALANVQ